MRSLRDDDAADNAKEDAAEDKAETDDAKDAAKLQKDITRSFTTSAVFGWRMHVPRAFVEKELQETMTDEQWESWCHCVKQYWDRHFQDFSLHFDQHGEVD